MRHRLRHALARLVERPDVAIAHEFRPPPYGGSNQFLLALRKELRRQGLRVGANVVARRTRACLLNAHVFDERELRRMLHADCRVVHRVDGPLALYRGEDDGTDALISWVNLELADATIFQSHYSLDACKALGLEFRDPVVIPNAVDPSLFHPPPARPPLEGRKVRLITTSWSDNPNKGAETYRWLEQRVDWDRFEWTFVGRTKTPFERIRVVPPVGSRRVGELLRENDVFLTASLHDPCSNSLLEALASGLPALYAASGGHAEIAGGAGLAFSDREEMPALLDRLVDELDERRRRISIAPLSEVADRYLAAMGLDGARR